MLRAGQEISVAPMMDRTDRHCRFFHRLLAPDIRLYTEMVVAQAAIHGDRERLLGFDQREQPLALQLGGSDPELLAQAATIGDEFEYGEININIGCPSDRVQSGSFGACLMSNPDLVADCVKAMRAATDTEVTIKTRIGIDDQEDYAFLTRFVETTAAAGCTTYVVHARKAILSGLSPKENRTIPPLHYDRVYRLKQDYPELRVIINGGIRSTPEVLGHLQHVDGVMIGRQAYSDPYWLCDLQALLDPEFVKPSRAEVVAAMAEYARPYLAEGGRLNHITRHMLGLFTSQPGARAWRRFVSEGSVRPDARSELLLDSLAL